MTKVILHVEDDENDVLLFEHAMSKAEVDASIQVAVQVPIQITVDALERRIGRSVVVDDDFIREAVAGSRDGGEAAVDGRR